MIDSATSPLKKRNAFAGCIVIGLLIFCAGIQEATAQYLQFSSAGTTSNVDSLFDNVAARRPKLNPSLYRNKYSDSLGQQINQYRVRYDDAFGKASQYRSKYGGDFREQLKQYRSLEKFNKYLHQSRKIQGIGDQLLSGKFKLDSSTVFNSKIMQKYTDSLKRVLPKPPTNPFKEVSEERLVDEVNKKFRDQADSLRDSTRWIGQVKKEKEWVDLNYAKLKSAHGDDLKPMVTSLVQTEVLKHIDSLRIADLKATRTKMDQKEKNAREQIAKFRQTESFWQKSYLEGIIGMVANQTSSFQFSPAWAYHILPAWSVGGGPNLTISRQPNVRLDVGARVLTKYEIFHRTVYFQAEDRIDPGAIGVEHKIFTQHNLMAGGGYVIPFLSPLTFNLSLMYKFYSNAPAENDGSSWMFRVGISTNKKPK